MTSSRSIIVPALELIIVMAAVFACATPGSAQQNARRRLTLSEAITLAKEQGLRMQAASQQLSAGKWQAQAFSARLRPQVFLTGNALNLDHGINPITLPDGTTQFVGQSNNQSTLGLLLSQPIAETGGTLQMESALSRNDQFGNLSRRSWQSTPFTLGINQPIFQPRTLEWQKRAQQATTSLIQHQFLENREDAGIEVVDAFTALYVADVTARSAASNAAISDTIFRVNQQRYSAARIDRIELGRSELFALHQRINRDNVAVVREQAAATLLRLLNLPRTTVLELEAPDSIPREDIDPDLAAQEATRNSSLRDQLELDAINADHDVDVARFSNGFNASVNAGVGFNQTAPTFPDAYQSPLGKQRFTVGVTLPIAQWGAGNADVQVAKALQSEAALNGRMRREQLTDDARGAAQLVVQAVQSVGLAARSDTLAALQFAIARNQYASGSITISDLLQIQQDKDNAVADHVQAIRGFWTQYYRLQRITLYDFIKRTPLTTP